eukprot:GHVQ01034612.1.p1 GENE.GHVQ01034612.1~~GHVQ01034612.1.p1  ORF type:complete len:160 (+),score=16.07 GHVQ01034612.1:552-1031(+)
MGLRMRKSMEGTGSWVYFGMLVLQVSCLADIQAYGAVTYRHAGPDAWPVSSSLKIPGPAHGQESSPQELSYHLDSLFVGTDFFSQFDFFTEEDPTKGFVEYVDRTTAYRQGLISTVDGRTQIRADWRHKVAVGKPGRMSVRLQSKKRWDEVWNWRSCQE